VAGLGRAGRAAADALSRFAGPDAVVAWDRAVTKETRRLQRALEARGVRTHLGHAVPTAAGSRPARTLIRSPGISIPSRPTREAREAGLEVIDELELGWRLSRTPILAVTGTNGKSTVAGLATALLTASGRRARLAGNTDFGEPLSTAAAEPLDWIVCEVSSYQLEGCPSLLPEVAVFTNLTAEHLARHRSMRRYGDAKRRLFVRGDTAVPRAIVDVDDPFGRELASDVEERGGTVLRVGFSRDADYRILSAAWDLRHAAIRLGTPSGEVSLETRLPGSYNARNVAAAVAIADMLEVEPAVAAATFADTSGPSGRFEHVDEGQGFAAVVDFAHTPDGIAQFLDAVRAGMSPDGRLRTVFGTAGRTRRPEMQARGRMARAGSDHLILTTSGFRGEPPLWSLQGHLQGARTVGGAEVAVVLDRRRAIERALREAVPGDAVVVLGRGAFSALTADARGVAIPFDDRVVVGEILRGL
jgi:UDP-N-acetylmuramoyl-L-alanyl-D-glutamate--2,6-diaminopimelate ligase